MLGPRKSASFSNIPLPPAFLAKTFATLKGVSPGRTVEEHCRIAGAVAEAFLERLFRSWPAGRGVFPKNSELGALLHDIGKISPVFQKRIHNSVFGLSENADVELEREWGGHAAVGMAAVKAAGADEDFAWCVGSHHGRRDFIPRGNDSPLFGGENWALARISLLESLKGERNFPVIAGVSQKLLVEGLTVLSDWIASGKVFSDPGMPWKGVVKPVLDNIGLVFEKPVSGLSFREVFGFSPNSCQKAMIGAVEGPGLYVLEAPMGKGKTEAALFAAYRLVAEGKACGMYFALPTRLTSDRIHERVEKFMARIFKRPPKLALVHGDAWLSETGDDWFGHGRRALLSPWGVGTVDQALVSAMRVPYSSLRLLGLAGKAVILDEIHSYDAYTSHILERLVARLAEIGSTVMILSATLTRARRSSIVRAAGHNAPGTEIPPPCLTAARHGKPAVEKGIPENAGTEVIVRLADDDGRAAVEAMERAEAGQQVLWVENTVRMAQEMFVKLKGMGAGKDIGYGLLHSRFIMRDRRANEEYWTGMLGRKGRSGKECRHERGRILVGTQIVEQSLDIDADFMVSRFAPADLVFQRLGRLWRHERKRPDGSRREIWLLAPKMEEARNDPYAAFSGTGTSLVYSPYVLARSLETWQGAENIFLPDDISRLLEATHRQRREKPGTPMFKAWQEERREVARKIGLAEQSVSALGALASNDSIGARLRNRETARVLILQDLNPNDMTCRAFHGDLMRLDRGMKKNVAAWLAGQAVSVPLADAPLPAPGFAQKLLAPYFHEARQENLRILISDPESGIMTAARHGQIGYNIETGYICKNIPL